MTEQLNWEKNRPSLPRIRLIVARGTLPSRGKDRMDFTNYASSGRPRITGRELLAEIPEVAYFAQVEADSDVPSDLRTMEQIRAMSVQINQILQQPDIDGVVLVEGTSVLEETAYFLSLTVHSAKPVIVTGAQRPFTALSSDAALNLLNAIRTAAHPGSWGKGVVVVANDEINAAREVTKTNTYRLQTFRSRDFGLLGYADPDRIVYYRASTRRHTASSEFILEGVDCLPHVAIIYIYSGNQPGMVEDAVERGARGIVVAGTGPGSLNELEQEITSIAAERRAIVVRSSRVGEGRVIGDSTHQKSGMVASDNLSPQKAAVLLSLALTRTSDPDDIQRMFDEY